MTSWRSQLNIFALSLCMLSMLWLAVRFQDVRDRNGRLLCRFSDLMWILAGFFILLWFARFDAHVDIVPSLDLLGWLRDWLWVPIAVIVIGAVRVWRALR